MAADLTPSLTARQRKAAAGMAAALFTHVVAGWLLLTHVGGLPGDGLALRFFAQGRPVGRDLQVSTFFGDVGTPGVAVLTVAVAATLVARSLGARAATMTVVAAAGAGLLDDRLKALLGPTPEGRRVFGEIASYPSGHVAYATGLFGLLAWLALRCGRRDTAVVCLLIVALMGPARVYAQSHLPSDVLAGYAVGLGWLLLVVAVGAPSRRAART